MNAGNQPMDEIRMVRQYKAASGWKQVAAGMMDLVMVVLIGMVVMMCSADISLTALCIMESILVLAVVEGAKGLTPGKAVLGLRTVRQEGQLQKDGGTLPAGMKRVAVKYAVLVVSFCAAIIGLFVTLCSPLLSRTPLKQGWADRLALLAVVEVRSVTYVAIAVRSQGKDASMDSDDESLDLHVAPDSSIQVSPVVRRPLAAEIPVAPSAPPSSPSTQRSATDAEPVPAVPPAPKAVKSVSNHEHEAALRVMLYINDRTAIPLMAGHPVVLGRKPEAVEAGDIPLVVEDATGTVSRSHLRLHLVDGVLRITDLGSTNGTTIIADGEEKRLVAHASMDVQSAVRISMGDLICTVMSRGRGEAA